MSRMCQDSCLRLNGVPLVNSPSHKVAKAGRQDVSGQIASAGKEWNAEKQGKRELLRQPERDGIPVLAFL